MLLYVGRVGLVPQAGEPTVLENEVFISAYGAIPWTPPSFGVLIICYIVNIFIVSINGNNKTV